MSNLPRNLLASALAALPVMAASDALASGFATARFGGEHGHPTTDNATALYYNPAGLAEDTPGFEKKDWRVKIFVDGNLALRWAGWKHETSQYDEEEPDDAKGANSGEASLFNVVAAPMAGASFQVENFGVGLGFFVPFGGQSAWGKNDRFEGDPNYAGPVDGVQRWHTIDGKLRSLYVTLGAAYDILDRVSLGVSANLVMSQIQTIRAREPSGTNSVQAEGRSLLDVSGLTGSLGLGIIGEIEPEKVWLGFSYQSQPGFGRMTLEGELSNNYGGSKSVDQVKALQELPDIYRVGMRARPIKTVEIRMFGDFTNWSVFNNQCIIPAAAEECEVNEDGSVDPDAANPPYLHLVRNWGPAFGFRAGGSYWVVPELEMFLGAGYDSNAIPDSTLEPALTDFHKGSMSFGARVAAGETFAAALSYTHIFYAPRDTTDDSVLPTLQPPSKSPDAGGVYTQTIGVINANVQVSF